jgi:ATP-binding cassette subfamily G (WHITE) protein 2 (SNQ2)
MFSARLRQPRETSDEEIESYVNKVIDVLELEELADAVIGIPGAGLSIEQRSVEIKRDRVTEHGLIATRNRKRTTIGVELVAKPKLLFLDEPTSGLGSSLSSCCKQEPR